MKYDKGVKMSKERDRPILHRKTGTIGIANLHRRKMLSSPMGNLAIFKSSVNLSNPVVSKHVRWAKPIAQVHYINVPTVVEGIALQQKVKMATMDFKPAINLMKTAAKPLNLTPHFCFDCQQYYSSQSKLNRHKGSQKHQQHAMLQSGSVNPLSPPKFKRVELALPIKHEFPAAEMDTIEIVTKPMDVTPFYCLECHQHYKNRKQLNCHKKTGKHLDNVHIQLRAMQNYQQVGGVCLFGTPVA